MADTTPAKPTEPQVPESKAPEAEAPAPTAAAAAAATTQAAAPVETPAAAPSAPEAEAPKEAASEAPAAAPATTEASKETKEPESAPAAPAAAPAEASAEVPAGKAVEAEAPAAAPTATTDASGWPEIKEDSPLGKFLADLPALLEQADYNEVYGLQIGGDNDFHTKLIAQKFLRANANDLPKAKEQLLGALKWRKEYQPLKAIDEVFAKEKFGGLGHVISVEDVPNEANKSAVVTFNLYGAVKDNKTTFGDLESFLRWRVALMELSLQKLQLSTATAPIPNYGEGPDPYQGYQVHDYMNVSFLRQDPDVKAAVKRTTDIFSKHYPETLSRKFFINVPMVMGWMFTAVKLVLPKETVRKFTVLTYGKDLAAELGPNIPEVYGGKASALETIAESTKLE